MPPPVANFSRSCSHLSWQLFDAMRLGRRQANRPYSWVWGDGTAKPASASTAESILGRPRESYSPSPLTSDNGPQWTSNT